MHDPLEGGSALCMRAHILLVGPVRRVDTRVRRYSESSGSSVEGGCAPLHTHPAPLGLYTYTDAR
jgi:hypothetical protein